MNRISLLLYAAVLGDCQGLATLGAKAWNALAEQCRQEDMDGLLYRRCIATEISIPDAVLAGLRESYRFTAAHNFCRPTGVEWGTRGHVREGIRSAAVTGGGTVALLSRSWLSAHG